MIPTRVVILFTLAASAFGASGRTIAVDSAGNLWTIGASLPVAVTSNAFQKTQVSSLCYTEQLSPFDPPQSVDCPHAFVMKQDNTGKVLYATWLGGSSADFAIAVTTDSQGNAYVTGSTYSADFPITTGVVQPHYAGPNTVKVIMPFPSPFGPREIIPGGDAFVVKFAPDGTVLYSTLLGGSGSEYATLIAADASGSAYIAGITASTDFPTTAAGPTPGAAALSFFAKLSPDGASLAWSSLFASTIQDFNIDAHGIAWLAGSVITKIDTVASRFLFARTFVNLDPQLSGNGAAIAIAPSGNVLIGVSPAPTLNPPLTFPQSVYPLGRSFLVTLASDGGSIVSETAVDNTQFDQLLFDSSGNAFALGHGTGALPSPTQLAAPCTSAGAEFAITLNAASKVTAATYLRQGSVPAALDNSSHLTVWRPATNQFIPIDITTTPAMNFGCLLNIASGVTGPGIAPGELFTVFGNNIGPAQPAIASGGPYPTTLAGVRVIVNGTPAPLLYVQSGEIHGVVPFGYSPPTATVEVQYQDQAAPLLDEPSSYSPGIFGIVNQDGTLNSPANPATRGSIISVYATGLGNLSSPVPDGSILPIPPPFLTVAQPIVSFGDSDGVVLYAGAAPTLIAGVDQVNAQVPPNLSATGAVPLRVIPPGVFSPPVTISIK